MLSLSRRLSNLQLFQMAFQSAADKLMKYISCDDGEAGQPAIKFLKAVRILNPARVCLLAKEQSEYSSIPGFESIPAVEYNGYINKYAPEAVAVAGGIWNECNIDLFWNSMSDKPSAIAIKYKDTVCNSADAERYDPM